LLHFFDGNDFARFSVGCLVDGTKGTISQRFYGLIFLHCTFNLSIKSISKTSPLIMNKDNIYNITKRIIYSIKELIIRSIFYTTYQLTIFIKELDEGPFNYTEVDYCLLANLSSLA
jgi:hypothetical protein